VSGYPEGQRERTEWILARRGVKNLLDPRVPYGAFVEEEIGPDHTLWETATVMLTNNECPFRCLMCDLWENTLSEKTNVGAIIAQLDLALADPKIASARAIKLYNAGSFFDPAAIPRDDWAEIAARVRHVERVIVESHTAFISEKLLAFRDAIAPARLEIAIGLETANPVLLEKLNKRMTVTDFERAAAFLRAHQIALRVFILVRPPFLTEEEGVYWACRSLDLATDCGADFSALIPTRAGNGALEALATSGDYAPPSIASLETCLDYGLRLKKGRVTADLWDIERFIMDPSDIDRIQKIRVRNNTQQ
jgi:archaeosine synthase beta-subunit